MNTQKVLKYCKKERSTTQVANYLKLGSGWVHSELSWYCFKGLLNVRYGKPNVCYWKTK